MTLRSLLIAVIALQSRSWDHWFAFLCSGIDHWVPSVDPSNLEYLTISTEYRRSWLLFPLIFAVFLISIHD